MGVTMANTERESIAYEGAQFIPVGIADTVDPQVEVATFDTDTAAGFVGLGVVYAADDSYMTVLLTPEQARNIADMLTAAADTAQRQLGAQGAL